MFVPVSGVLIRSPIDSNVASRKTRIRRNMKNYKHLKLNLKRKAEETKLISWITYLFVRFYKMIIPYFKRMYQSLNC